MNIQDQIHDKIESIKNHGGRNLILALIVSAGYMVVYLLGRVLYTNPGDYTIGEWLLGTEPIQLEYLYGWIVRGPFWWVFFASMIGALIGWHRFSFLMLFACTAGLLLGEPLGDNPAGSMWGQGHYGWLLWIGFCFVAFIMGITFEKLYKKHGTYKHSSFFYAATATFIGWGWFVIYTLMSVQNYVSLS